MIDFDPTYTYAEDRLWGAGVKFTGWMMLVAFLFSLTTGGIDPPQPKYAPQEPVSALVKAPVAIHTVEMVTGELTLRTFWARALRDRRQDEQVVDTRTEGTEVPQAATQQAAAPVAESRQVALVSEWKPSDECGRIHDPNGYIASAAMQMCPAVARTLDWWDRRYPGSWEQGELAHLLMTMTCESNASFSALNPSSGTWGRFQHRPKYWSSRARLWLGGNEDRTESADIIVAVALVNDPRYGQGYTNAWDGCHIVSTGPHAREFRAALAAAGIGLEEHDVK